MDGPSTAASSGMLPTKPSVVGVLSAQPWVEWQQQVSGLHAVPYTDGEPGQAVLSATLYTDQRGRVVTPPLTPYTPVRFQPTSTCKPERLVGQWEERVAHFAAELRRRSVRGYFDLPPELMDARPFLAAGFRAEVRYTVAGKPDVVRASAAFHRRVRKALRSGFTAGTTTDLAGVRECLTETSGRKRFDIPLSGEDLSRLQAALGPERFRVHVVRSAEGEVVSAAIQLVSAEGAALHWLQGSKSAYLNYGVVQLAYHEAMTDLASSGVTHFDLGGANIPAIARHKIGLGLEVVPYITLQQIGPRLVARDLLSTARVYRRTYLPRRPSVTTES